MKIFPTQYYHTTKIKYVHVLQYVLKLGTILYYISNVTCSRFIYNTVNV